MMHHQRLHIPIRFEFSFTFQGNDVVSEELNICPLAVPRNINFQPFRYKLEFYSGTQNSVLKYLNSS